MVELRTLGNCQIVVGRERIGPQSPYAFALALYLAIERGRPHSRDQLLPIFFPGVPEPNAAHSLRQNLYKLRQLGVPAETTPAGTMIAATAVRDDYSALLATSELPDPHAERLPGEFLPGYWPKISDEYTRWLDTQRDAINSALRRAYVSRILDRRAVARWDEVERFARACLAIDPLNEEATLGLAEALALSGSKAAGVKVLDKYLEEIGSEAGALALPATVLRRRISERYRPTRSVGDLPLIGREEEIKELSRSLMDAVDGRMVAVWLSGEPGIGKTRLLRELSGSSIMAGGRVLEVTCHPHDIHRPLGILCAIVPTLLELPGALGASPETLDLLRSLNTTSVVQPDTWSDPASSGGAALTRRLYAAFYELLDAVASESLIVIVIDDAHWGDPLSKQFLDTFFTHDSPGRVLTVVSSRDAPGSTIQSHTCRHIAVRRISKHHARDFVRKACQQAGASLPPEAMARATHLGGGNPFYLRSLTEHFVANPTASSIPTRLAELIAQRISCASRSAHSVLLSCALLGRHASVDMLESVLEMRRFELASELDSLEAANLIHVSGQCIEIAHALIADCLLPATSDSASLLIHQACASALERSARSTGDLGQYWAAYECWSALGNIAAASRCAAEATTIDAIGALLGIVDAAVTRPAAPQATSPTAYPQQRDAVLQLLTRSVGRESASPATHGVNGVAVEVNAAWLIDVANDPHKSCATRLRAAVAALAIAEHNFDAGLAAVAHQAATDAGRHATGDATVDLLRIRLAFHTVFGDPSVALRIAADHEMRLITYDTPDATLRSGINCAEAYARCGHSDQALRFFDTLYSLAVDESLVVRADAIAVRATWVARQIGSMKELESWRCRSLRGANIQTSRAYPSYLYNEALLAGDAKDWSAVAYHSACLAELTTGSGSAFHWALTEALSVQAAAFEKPESVNRSSLDQLRDWSLRTCALVPEDDVAFAVTLGTDVSDGRSAASTFVAKYLRMRRTCSIPMLAKLANLHETLTATS